MHSLNFGNNLKLLNCSKGNLCIYSSLIHSSLWVICTAKRFDLSWKCTMQKPVIISINFRLTLCSPSSKIGTATPSPNSIFGTDNRATQTELNPIVLHLCTQWYCLELNVTIHWIPIVSYSGELPVLSLLLVFQLRYLGIHKNNLAFSGFSTK